MNPLTRTVVDMLRDPSVDPFSYNNDDFLRLLMDIADADNIEYLRSCEIISELIWRRLGYK